MKILITGGTGFLGQELRDYFGGKHSITSISSNDVDLRNEWETDFFFETTGEFDYVFHTAFVGGKRGNQDTFQEFTDNIRIFNNILRNKEKYRYLFNFCSGAAFDMRYKNINTKEKALYNRSPEDYYGSAKNQIAKEVNKEEGFYNFRLFGCFGKYEEDTRFIKRSIKRVLDDKDIEIHNDRTMSFISATDVCKVLEYYISELEETEPHVEEDINLVYKSPYKLSEIAKKIIDLTKTKKGVIIQSNKLIPHYEGSGHKLDSEIDISLDGIEKGIEEVIEYVNRQKAEDS